MVVLGDNFEKMLECVAERATKKTSMNVWMKGNPVTAEADNDSNWTDETMIAGNIDALYSLG